ncbi:hypothetical protein BKA66DRAFT_507914 [Pyrenochaeta sp. MPI-SDFR-AT-0127]|nr:hypothetical protein BKA66DRAFT_507914 [Pyrenochaeta sp. MPI-SDFR-AT-0127]
MCSTTPAYLGQRSRLLQLPQEIRDLIFEHLLVRDVISIECAVVSIPTRYTPSRVHSQCEEIYKMYPLRRTRTHRRIWSIPAFDIDLAFSGRDSMNSPETVHMTYQLAESKTSSPTCEVQIGLLQVCKQIYSEAMDIFYSKNIFSFTADYRIPTAFAFFCDRPAASLLLIRSLQLALTEDNNMRGTTEAHFPITRRSTDSLVLQYAYRHFTNLCNLLSTPRMQLRTLHLIVDTLDSRNDIAPGSVQQCLIWEEQKINALRPWIAAWIDPLLKVGELDSIMIHWIFDRPRLRRMSDTVIALRQHMLTCKQSKTRHRKDSLIDARFSFQMQHRQNEGREGELSTSER